MPLTQAMRDLFTKFTTTEDSTTERFGTTSAYMFVGTSTVAFNSASNKLETGVASGSSGAIIRPMDSGYPKRNDGTDSTAVNILAYQATYSTAIANFEWMEWGVKNTTATATGTGTMLNRALNTGLGTKTSAQAWQILAKITVST